MKFKINDKKVDIQLNRLIVAGWTGRNQAAIDHHIKELAEIGVAPPSEVPLFYQASLHLVTHHSVIESLGETTSGEVEPFVIQYQGNHYLGLASDHTDRELEAYSVAYSKQICAKPVAEELWLLDDVLSYIDEIKLKSWIFEKNDWVLYQSGTLAEIRPILELLERCPLSEGDAMLCGTFAAIGGVRVADQFKMQMKDPKTNRKINWQYEIKNLKLVK